MVETTARALAALGIENGPSYTQLRIGVEASMVIEVAARLGGGHDAELAHAVTGIDLNDLALDAALGLPLEAPGVERARRRRGDALPRRAAGRARRASRCRPGSKGFGSTASPATCRRLLRHGSDRAGAVLVTGSSREDAVSRAEQAAEAIRFRVASEPALAG